MLKRVIIAVSVGCILVCCNRFATAQILPKIQLRPVFPALKLGRVAWMSEAPDHSGRLFIVEQAGRIIVVQKGSDGSTSNEFLNIVDRNPFVNEDEGLLSMAFYPGFTTNRYVYVSYNQQAPTNPPSLYPARSIISEFMVSTTNANRAEMKTERRVMTIDQPFGGHKGGEVGFGPDGCLYIGLGDGGSTGDPYNNAQNPASALGKILRIDVNRRTEIVTGRIHRIMQYGIPQDNPFAAEPTLPEGSTLKEIYALGLCNPLRFSWDRKTGELWAGDAGQDSWEEVDLIVKGGNYGWCVRDGAHHFKPGPTGARYIDPVLEYPQRSELLSESKFPDHTVGSRVIGGYVYRGKKYPSLDGVYVYADYTEGTIWGLRYGGGKVTDYGTMLAQPKNIVSFAEDADGELYALTFENGAGRIYAIEPE